MLRNLLKSLLDNRLSIFVVVVFASMMFLGYHIHISTENFDHTYREYAVVAARADASAYLPSAGNNSVRQALNNVLIQVLGNSTLSDAERYAYAKDGIELIRELDKQVDDISTRLEETDEYARSMNAAADYISSVFAKGLPQKIVGLAQKRHEAISDIRAYSYRADSQARQILEHIVSENGKLTPTYIKELNNLLPAQEEEFNLRTNRYSDLQRVSTDMDDSFKEFVKRFAIENRE